MPEILVMISEGENGMESGCTGPDPLAVGIGNGKSDSGASDPAHAFGAPELPLVKLGLLGASRRKDNSVPCWNSRRMSHRQS